MPRVPVYIVVVSILICIAHAQKTEEAKLVKEEVRNVASGIDAQEELFKQFFRKRRKEHLDAVKNLQKIDNYERTYKMVKALAEKIVEVIETNKVLLENSGFSPSNKTFPQSADARDALASILENTAFFGDIILHLPYITHRMLKTHQNWNSTVYWSLNFVNQMRHLLDKGTKTMIHLLSQELNITEREPGYFNPYWGSSAEDETMQETLRKKKSPKKEKRKRGPQMINIEL